MSTFPGQNQPSQYPPYQGPGRFPVQENPPRYPPNEGPGSFPVHEFPPITTQPQITVVPIQTPPLGPGPALMICPRCGAEIMTAVSDVAITKTHAFALGICCLGGVLGCCLIPYCISSCQGQRHDCPNCGHNIGFFK